MSYFGKRVFSADTSGYKVVRRGQFAYATNHIEEGSIGLLEDADAGLVSPMYTVFEAEPNRVHARFLFALFKTEFYRHIFEINTNASVNRRGSLRWSQFKTIRVALPTIEELASLIEESSTNGVHISRLFDSKQKRCWSADGKQFLRAYGAGSGAWIVDFKRGKTAEAAWFNQAGSSGQHQYEKNQKNNVRAVRTVAK